MPVRKRFGQHFLHDPGVIRRLVEAIDPRPGEHLVEIGPGRGALTWPLLERARRLEVIEIDRDLAAALAADPRAPGALTIHEADALGSDFEALRVGGPALRIVGNLPYNISTPLLFHLITQRAALHDMTVMLQREVVARMTAPPGGKSYGRLTVMLAAYCEVRLLFEVGPGAFQPAPRVWSAVARLRPSLEPRFPLGDEAVLRSVVTAAFSQRRKTLRNALKGLLSEAQVESCGIDPALRPETLAPADFGRLAACYCQVRSCPAGGA
ncbi:MAG TPA: 16S rRNA (adenine(1518)-N(6)/adenine(1519)-N(6))-dimethyltransferase RsmA [Steroidobacteraceae bacterium]|nr:16S rRNA (adenine(1518)-N(6)/adenine(1519)-N(6))-dimethyltransferase RsmA [Steroidobacteraceae bacterium]